MKTQQTQHAWCKKLKKAEAFSPGHITGFFQIYDQPEDPLLRGSRGAGVSITRGVTTTVHVEKAAETSVKIKINDVDANSALVSEHVTKAFLSLTKENYKVLIEHDVKVPIGRGFGTSGAGALSLALALNEVFNLNLSRLETAQMAHTAEIECKTGLGTVIAETFGGFEIRVKAGAPGVGQVKSLPLNGEYAVACLSLGSIPTREILTNNASRRRINEFGKELVDELVRHPTIRNFMEFSHRFAEHVGLISKRLRAVLEEADRAGLPCSMAMLGETAFSIVKRDQVKEIHKVFRKHASSEQSLIITEIDFEGARVL